MPLLCPHEGAGTPFGDFYSILETLEKSLGGARTIAECTGRAAWPRRGLYLFREPGERCSDTGTGPRIVRIATHALTGTSRTTLWRRLSQHRGRANGGGDHRTSIFRLLVGSALILERGLSSRPREPVLRPHAKWGG